MDEPDGPNTMTTTARSRILEEQALAYRED
jgi:hypothetical protein